MYDRYEHHFHVYAIRTPAGISWSLKESDPELTVYDRDTDKWVDMPVDGMLGRDDRLMMNDLLQRLYIFPEM